MFEPMLLSSFSEEVFKEHSSGWYMSEKYDGWRAIYKDNKFYTRAGNEIKLPQRFYDSIQSMNLPSDTILDGELWVGFDRFNDVHAGIAGECDLFYQVFDVPSVKGNFSDRLNALRDMFTTSSTLTAIKMVQYTYVRNTDIDIVNKELANVVKHKGEGLVLRLPNESYTEGKRSQTFLKYKPYDTTEAVVLGHYTTKQKQNETGYVSSVVCTLAEDKEQKTFSVTWKKNNPPEIGSLIVIKFTHYTVNGLPKFPVFVGMRDAKDLKIKILNAYKKKSNYTKAKDLFNMVPDRTKTVEEWKELGGYDLKPGQSVWVESKRDIYKITKAKFGNYYCSCPAWKYQRLPPIERTCKHCNLIKGQI